MHDAPVAGEGACLRTCGRPIRGVRHTLPHFHGMCDRSTGPVSCPVGRSTSALVALGLSLTLLMLTLKPPRALRRLAAGRGKCHSVALRCSLQESSLRSVPKDALKGAGWRRFALAALAGDVNGKTPNGWTALHCAAISPLEGSEELCRRILSRQDFVGLNLVDGYGRSALSAAAFHGRLGVCHAILEQNDFAGLNRRDKSGWTALHLAATKGYFEVCSAILDRRDFTEINSQDRFGRTALHVAVEPSAPPWCERAEEECISTAQAEVKGSEAGSVSSAAMVRAMAGQKTLEEIGQAMRATKSEAVSSASETCNVILARQDFAAVNAEDQWGLTALHHAAAHGDTHVCRAIVARPDFVNVNTRDAHGSTVLHWAAMQGDADVCMLILEKPEFAHVHAQDAQARTALQWASARGLEEVCRKIESHLS
mmetsp:Transcript_139154/g.444060  ORF Transcript_139154/g.444060 Transcript_139154/m.444060 type:complete len:426 (+) Transcript_139154:99-1376(+)